jgi:hypothetical protein
MRPKISGELSTIYWDRALHLESVSGRRFGIPTSFHACPDVLAKRAGPIKEGLQLTLLQTAFLTGSASKILVRVLIADLRSNQKIDITADRDDIVAPLKTGRTTSTDYEASVWSAATVGDFLQNLCPEVRMGTCGRRIPDCACD